MYLTSPFFDLSQSSVFNSNLVTSRAFSFVSNTFNFVFRFDDTVCLRRVLPSTHEESVVLVRIVANYISRHITVVGY